MSNRILKVLGQKLAEALDEKNLELIPSPYLNSPDYNVRIRDRGMYKEISRIRDFNMFEASRVEGDWEFLDVSTYLTEDPRSLETRIITGLEKSSTEYEYYNSCLYYHLKCSFPHFVVGRDKGIFERLLVNDFLSQIRTIKNNVLFIGSETYTDPAPVGVSLRDWRINHPTENILLFSIPSDGHSTAEYSVSLGTGRYIIRESNNLQFNCRIKAWQPDRLVEDYVTVIANKIIEIFSFRKTLLKTTANCMVNVYQDIHCGKYSDLEIVF